MVDQLVREIDPTLFRNFTHEILLDLVGVLVMSQPKTVAQTFYVCVHNHTVADPKGCSQYDVGSLSSDTGKTQQFFHVFRDPAFE